MGGQLATEQVVTYDRNTHNIHPDEFKQPPLILSFISIGRATIFMTLSDAEKV